MVLEKKLPKEAFQPKARTEFPAKDILKPERTNTEKGRLSWLVKAKAAMKIQNSHVGSHGFSSLVSKSLTLSVQRVIFP